MNMGEEKENGGIRIINEFLKGFMRKLPTR